MGEATAVKTHRVFLGFNTYTYILFRPLRSQNRCVSREVGAPKTRSLRQVDDLEKSSARE